MARPNAWNSWTDGWLDNWCMDAAKTLMSKTFPEGWAARLSETTQLADELKTTIIKQLIYVSGDNNDPKSTVVGVSEQVSSRRAEPQTSESKS